MLKKLLQKTCEGGIIKEDMKIFEPKERNGELCERLLEIWESYARAAIVLFGKTLYSSLGL